MHMDFERLFRQELEDGHLSLNSRCDANCFFCSQKYIPPGFAIYPIDGFVDKTLVQRNLAVVPDVLFAGSGKRFLAGEPLLHPEFDEIVGMIFDHRPDLQLSINTTGNLLTERFLRRFSGRDLKLIISLNAANPALRARIMGTSEREARRGIENLALIKRFGIKATGSIVVIPRMLTQKDIAEATFLMENNGFKRIRYLIPGYTRTMPKNLQKLLQVDPDWIEGILENLRHECSAELKMDPSFDDPRFAEHLIERLGKLSRMADGKRILLFTSFVAEKEIRLILSQLGISEIEVIPVRNTTFGGNICVAGLLTNEDIILEIETRGLRLRREEHLILLPKEAYGESGLDLCNRSYKEIEERYHVSVMIL